MSVLSELCIPFVRISGEFIAYKSSDSDEEIHSASKAIQTLSGSDASISDVEIPDTGIFRKLVMVKKKISTAKKYPRKPGIPSKNPIRST